MSHFIPKCGLICTSELKFASLFNKNDSKIGNFITKWQKLEEKSLKPISKCQKFLSKSQKLLSKCQKTHIKIPKTPNYRNFIPVDPGGFCSKKKPAKTQQETDKTRHN